ncbi:M56 family metallopeptidase [Acidianus sp.]|uniref:M56 family metallopeptidase n=1 Tax=Acidianus sp. TaxID=1872104 RepID=UPI0039794DE3
MVTRYWLRYYIISFASIAVIDVIVSSIVVSIPFFYIFQIIMIFGLWYFISPFTMIALLKMRKGGEGLVEVVDKVSKKFGVKTPRVYISYVDFPNALAFGNILFRGMAVTSPLLDLLNDQELEAVIAHEISHLKNHDPEVLILSIIGINSIYSFLIYFFSCYLSIIVIFYFLGLFPLFFAIHRRVEKRADITAVKKDRSYAIPLETALIKIAYLSDKLPSYVLKNFPELQILLMKYDIISSNYGNGGLFRTHPSLSERLRYLSNYEY